LAGDRRDESGVIAPEPARDRGVEYVHGADSSLLVSMIFEPGQIFLVGRPFGGCARRSGAVRCWGAAPLSGAGAHLSSSSGSAYPWLVHLWIRVVDSSGRCDRRPAEGDAAHSR